MSTEPSKYLTLGQLARRLPAPDGRAVSASTVFRWATRGIRGHRLAVIIVGGRRLTTFENYLDFAARLGSGTPEPTGKTVPVSKKAIRFRDPDKVLARAGI